MKSTRPLLTVHDLSKSFGGTAVLRKVDLAVEHREVVVLMGRSGSGKTTLLRCLNLLVTPDSGRIAVGETIAFDDGPILSKRQLVEYRRKVGMVFQAFHLFPHLTAVENVMLPLVKGLGIDKDQAAEQAVDFLSRVGLRDKLFSMPSALSGGQQQRVAIARALALRPDVLLFDEPTSALDPESTDEVLGVMKDLSTQGATMVVVTHEVSFARNAADRIVFMADGEIVEDGEPGRVIDEPQDSRVRDFMAPNWPL